TVDAQTVEHIRAYRRSQPHLGKESIARLLQADHGIAVSGSTVGRVIRREGLYFGATPLHWKKRLQRQQEAEVPQEEATPQEDAPSAPEPVQLPLLPLP